MDKNSYESSIDHDLVNRTHKITENISDTTKPKETNTTDELNVKKPEHDKGVVKITSDNTINTSSTLQPTTISIKQNKKKDKQSMDDDSTLNLIEILNSNLTNIQVLLRFLNDKVNSKTIEAIIQSTGTESNDDRTTEDIQNISSNEQSDRRHDVSDFNDEENGELFNNERDRVVLFDNNTASYKEESTSDANNTDESKLCKHCDNSTLSFITHLENSILNTTNVVKVSSMKFIFTNFLRLLCSGTDNDPATRTIQNRLKEIIAKVNSSDTNKEAEEICKLYKKASTSVNLQLRNLPVKNNKNVFNDGSRHTHTEDISLGM